MTTPIEWDGKEPPCNSWTLREDFWGIISDDGKHYEVLSDSFFPDEFQVSGLRVEFVGYRHGKGSPILKLMVACAKAVYGL